MEVFVIKNDGGKYLKRVFPKQEWFNKLIHEDEEFNSYFELPALYGSYEWAELCIEHNKLKNCKPVKIEIREVEDE